MTLTKYCHGCYYPLHRDSLGTGPRVVDREQYTIIDVYDGIYSESRCEFHKLSMEVICTRGLYNGWQEVLNNDNEQWQLNKLFTWYKALINLTIL